MAVILTNTQSNEVVVEAYKQAVGELKDENGNVIEIDVTNIIDGGDKNPPLNSIRDQFTKSLIAVLAKRWFTQTSYRSQYKDPFYVDEMEFKLIIESISVSVPEVQENPAWANFVSGQTQIGVYTVFLPIVDTNYYAKTSSWSLPLTISWEQWSPAMYNREQLDSFVNYCLMCLDNAIIAHRENMNNLNRNNAMMARLESENPTCKVNLVEYYSKEMKGNVDITLDEAMVDPEFFVYSAEKVNGIVDLFKKQTNLFTTDKSVKFTPEDRLVVQLLGKFVDRMNGIARSQIFHNELVKMPLYEKIPFWQLVGDGSFNDVSHISMENGDLSVDQTGVVGFIADKWGVMHTIKKERVASQYFDIENITHYSYQFVDQYMNDLSQNGVVLYVADYEAPKPPTPTPSNQ